MESATPLASKFGVEIETRIQGLGDEDSPDMSKEQDNSEPTEEQKQMKRWERHVDPLSAELAKMNVGNHLMADQYEKEKETYEEWYLTQDDSINTQDGSWGVELVSPVFDYLSRHHWKDQLSRVYTVINHKPYISDPDETCALHVHISIEPTWNADRVRRLAAAIIRYTPQFEQLARKAGRTSEHAVEQAIANPNPNPNPNPSSAVHIQEQQYPYLQSLETTRDIVEALCPKDTRVLWTRDEGPRPPRHYFWNLWPLVGLGFDENEGRYFVKRTGTVEFRLPPSPKSDVDAAAWIDLVNLFVLGAVSGSDGDSDGDGDGDDTGSSSLSLFVQGWGRRFDVPAKDLERVEELLDGLK